MGDEKGGAFLKIAIKKTHQEKKARQSKKEKYLMAKERKKKEKMAKKIGMVYIPCKNRAEAKKIAISLLKKRLIACANLFPISSFYHWKGKIEKSSEIVLIGKSKKKNHPKIIREVKTLHSYKIPCVMMLDAYSNEEYIKWVEDQIR